jgi:DnaJ family protein C protein 19
LLLRRESAAEARVKEAQRKVMQANHPDSGGSDYLATKVNEAKSVMLSGKGGQGGSSSAF